jgi:hypothetical protein
MGERSEAVPREFEGEVDSIASRLATALASLHEFPAVRYRAGKPPAAGDAPGSAARSLLAQKLAQRVSKLAAYVVINSWICRTRIPSMLLNGR